MQKLMDLKVDFAFKQIFGKAGNAAILIAFLNAVLGLAEDQRIVTIQHLNPEFPRHRVDGKTIILDVLVVTERDVHINIEIQLSNKYDMEKRTLLYWSQIYADQDRKGAPYKKLSQTITINLLNFRLLKDTERYHTTFRLYEDQEKFPLTDVMEIHFLEIPKALKAWEIGEVDVQHDQVARWLLVFQADKHGEIRSELEAMRMQDPALKQLFEQWEALSQDDALWYEFRARRKALMDEYSARVEAEERGEERGERRGEQRGEKKGRIAVAKNMLEEKLDFQIISKVTGLSVDELEELQKQLH